MKRAVHVCVLYVYIPSLSKSVMSPSTLVRAAIFYTWFSELAPINCLYGETKLRDFNMPWISTYIPYTLYTLSCNYLYVTYKEFQWFQQSPSCNNLIATCFPFNTTALLATSFHSKQHFWLFNPKDFLTRGQGVLLLSNSRDGVLFNFISLDWNRVL